MNLYFVHLFTLFFFVFLNKSKVIAEFHSYSQPDSSERSDPNGDFHIGREIRRAAVGRFGDREFRLFVERKTWPEAILQCEKKGLEIGEVRTMDEARMLAGIMLKNRPDAIESAWIGGYGRNMRGNISWRWLSGDVIHKDNELWKIHLPDQKNRDKRRCLLLDWHLWEKPSYMEASCDRRREYICQNLINSEPIMTKVNHEENRRLLDTFTPTTTTTKKSLNFTTILLTTERSSSSQSSEIITWHPKKVDVTKNTSNLQKDYDDYYYNNDWFDSLTWKISTNEPVVSQIQSTTISKKEEQMVTTEKLYVPQVKSKPTTSILGSKKEKKALDPLKLYYAFEGPIVGGISPTESPELRLNFYSNPLPVLRYHKYAIRRKHKNSPLRN